ncbi:hypothetical protein AX14_004340 [Amanita brunnescens Koide BX004]|nr:hypothetical protein AX14_004340 [Amanita brunnescens Koide BX004]
MFPDITIEWISRNPDGSRRKPPPSTIHGWLSKWRGTFLGNERLRSKGMKEMRDATVERRRRSAKKRQAKSASSGRSMFSFFTFPRRKPARTLTRSTHHSNRSKPSHRGHPTRATIINQDPDQLLQPANKRDDRSAVKHNYH